MQTSFIKTEIKSSSSKHSDLSCPHPHHHHTPTEVLFLILIPWCHHFETFLWTESQPLALSPSCTASALQCSCFLSSPSRCPCHAIMRKSAQLSPHKHKWITWKASKRAPLSLNHQVLLNTYDSLKMKTLLAGKDTSCASKVNFVYLFSSKFKVETWRLLRRSKKT